MPEEALRESIKSIARLLDLEENWDTYGSGPIDSLIAAQAIEWVARMFHADTPKCQATPCSNGSVQLEWHENGIDLEIYFVQGKPTFLGVVVDEPDIVHEDVATKRFIAWWLKRLTEKVAQVA